MTTPPTASQRTLEAVAKALEIMATLTEAQEEVTIAKRTEDGVRIDNQVPIVKAEAAKRLEEANAVSQEICDQAIALATQPLTKAQAEYQLALQQANENRDTQRALDRSLHDQAIADAEQVQKLLEAAARAGVHMAQQKVANIQQTMADYRKQILQQLGIDLQALVHPSTKEE